MADGVKAKSKSLSEKKIKELVNNNGLSVDNFLVPDVYKEIFYDNYRYFILSSGRISGKTSILVAIWWVFTNKYPDRDIVVLQATATEIKDSIINEIDKFLRNSGFDVGEEPTCEWYIPNMKAICINIAPVGVLLFLVDIVDKPMPDSLVIADYNHFGFHIQLADKRRNRLLYNNGVLVFLRLFKQH